MQKQGENVSKIVPEKRRDTMRILIAGCGNIGSSVGMELAAQGCQVWGLRRNPERLPQQIRGLCGDLSEIDSLSVVLRSNPELLIFCPTPDEFTASAYHLAYVQGMSNLLSVLSSSRPAVIMVSSTSVYHQADGEWVSEESPTDPRHFAGEALLAAENTLRAFGGVFSILRCAGIYGRPGSRMLEKAKQGKVTMGGDKLFTNRIHVEDCIGAICHLARRILSGQAVDGCYLLADSQPAPLSEVETWLARQCGARELVEVPLSGRRRLLSNKRCDNSLLLASGYVLKHPNYRQGYAEILRS